MSKPIHQEVEFKATPQKVYEALTDGIAFAKATGGAPAEISREPGGAFSCFGGMITGRQIELVPGKRLVQAWRAGNWAEGVYSIVRYELQPKGYATRLVFDHTGFPEETREHLDAGWHQMYWEPLSKFLAQGP